MSKLLPILSDGLLEVLKSIVENEESRIASELIEAHHLTEAYNSDFFWMDNRIDRNIVKQTMLNRINELITDEVRALSIRRDVFEISFTPKGKELHYSNVGTWSRDNRQVGKPGRVIKKLMKFDYKERDIEVFNNLLKAHIVFSGEFKLVSGTDITKYYNRDNYYKCLGTLGNSCMRYDECREYFHIYEDHAKMLVLFNKDLVMGRAIVWEIDGSTYMDRVYVCEDYLEEQFYNYAKENGWYVRDEPGLLSTGDVQVWVSPTGVCNCNNICINLKKRYEYLPYMDSFRYYNPDENSINTDPAYGDLALDSTDGDYEGYPWTCDCCGDTFYSYDEEVVPDDLVWSDYLSEYLCSSCRKWNEGLQDYIRDCNEVVSVSTSMGLIDYPLEFVTNNVIDEFDTEYLDDDKSFIEINGDWYRGDHPRLVIVKDKIVLN